MTLGGIAKPLRASKSGFEKYSSSMHQLAPVPNRYGRLQINCILGYRDCVLVKQYMLLDENSACKELVI
jgi:hypothetical protein